VAVGVRSSAIVELDYDGLCDFMTWDELDDDRSARDVQDAIKALSFRGALSLGRAVPLGHRPLGRGPQHESLN